MLSNNSIKWLQIILLVKLVYSIPLDESAYSTDDSQILSVSRNLTVHLNETIQLPCLVKKSPNTVVIWNQCEDPDCNQMRSPITINKDNFIQDLRFRIVSENLNNEETSSSNTLTNSDLINESIDATDLETSKKLVRDLNNDNSNTNINNNAAVESDINSWNLEIRKFSKNDEACYQCQLNTFRTKTISYCIKLQKKITVKSKKLTVQLDEPIKLKCSTDENVRMSSIRWYRNGQKLIEENNSNIHIDRVASNDHIHSTLTIKKASLSDAGSYMCKFDKLHEKMHVDVVIGLKGASSDKSSVVRSNMENKKLVSSFSNSISITSSATSFKMHLLINTILILLLLLRI